MLTVMFPRFEQRLSGDLSKTMALELFGSLNKPAAHTMISHFLRKLLTPGSTSLCQTW